LVLNDLKATTS